MRGNTQDEEAGGTECLWKQGSQGFWFAKRSLPLLWAQGEAEYDQGKEHVFGSLTQKELGEVTNGISVLIIAVPT
jgi:hypothetical protein